MDSLYIADGKLEVSAIGLGCMRITGLGTKDAVRELVDTAMDQGINFFDHADIYADGNSEGKTETSAKIDSCILQTHLVVCLIVDCHKCK